MGYKLYYFNGKGRAEPVRLLFAHAGVQYEDKRLEGAEWPAVKPTTPWGNMPILEDGDFKLAQSVPILQYVAAKHGYAGATAQETAKCNEYVGAINDFYQGFREAGAEPDQEKKKERLAKFTKETQPFYLSKFESILTQNGSYLVGSKITFVDFYVAHILESYAGANPGVLDAYPSLKKHQETVFGAPGVKEWVAKRPVTPF